LATGIGNDNGDLQTDEQRRVATIYSVAPLVADTALVLTHDGDRLNVLYSGKRGAENGAHRIAQVMRPRSECAGGMGELQLSSVS
jgi:hypothetical protein